VRISRHFAALGLALTLVLVTVFPAGAIPRLLVDMYTGEVLYAEEAGQPWHPASLTKLMTALVTFEAIAAQRVTLETPVIMSARALKEPPSKVGLPVDTAITLEDALYFLIVKSANDVAVAIAETVSGSVEKFVDEMNVTARALGMTATHYENPNGLHNEAQVTSARDLAILALTIRARHPQYAQMFATEAVMLGKARLESHNDLLTKLAGTTGMKTGYVCASGLNIVATVERGGKALMAVVLGGSSARERAELTAELVVNGLNGRLTRAARSIVDLPNDQGVAPVNMRPYICGKEARDYVASREAAYPLGLEGQPTYLTDDVAAVVHNAHTLGRLRDVPVPRPRPLSAPQPKPIPLPRPRPTYLRAGI
jgi:D-alanyl-D-alanine carboxypeptidase